MNIPNWVDNKIKYQRALVEANNPENEKEVKKIYVSFGGKLINDIVVEEKEPVRDEVAPIVEETPVVEEVVEEVIE